MRVQVIISGTVQGVGFRASAYQQVQKLGLKGKVWNRSDGRVQGIFEGEPSGIEQIIDWCRHGPVTADVTDVEVIEEVL
jgi:acylphosphatase